MRRRRRGKTPPAPQNAIDADKFLRDELNRDTIYAKYYIGLVQSDDDGYALLFASRGNHICNFILLATKKKRFFFVFPENIAKLGVHTKVVQCDGTFRGEDQECHQ